MVNHLRFEGTWNARWYSRANLLRGRSSVDFSESGSSQKRVCSCCNRLYGTSMSWHGAACQVVGLFPVQILGVT